MKILFVTETLPFPLDTGGRIRSYHILRHLSELHDVTLLTTDVADSMNRGDSRKHAPESFCRVIKVAAQTPRERLWLRISSIIFRKPVATHSHMNPRLKARVRELLTDTAESFDTVHMDHLDAAIYIDEVDEQRVTIDLHNIVTEQVRTTLESERRWWVRMLLAHQILATRQFEQWAIERADAVTVCSENDKQVLGTWTETKRVSVVPNGVDTEYFSVLSKPTAQQAASQGDRLARILFFGALDYLPGHVGARWYIEKVVPILRSAGVRAEHLIVGQNPPQDLVQLASKDISITGRVEDLRPIACSANVFVAPLLSGSGTRLKILTAMAMGLPVVSTTIGAEGIIAKEGRDILLADTPHEFAEAIEQILQSETLAKNLAFNGRNLVENTILGHP